MSNGRREGQHSHTYVLGAVWRKSMCRSPKSVSLHLRPWIVLIWATLRIALAIDFWVVKSEVLDVKVGTVMESKYATFFEDVFPMKDMQSTSRQESEETPEPAIPMEYYEQTHDENPEKDDEETLGRGKRQRTAKSFGDDFLVYIVDDTPTSIL